MTRPAWQPRSEVELIADQLAGIDAWNAAQRRIREEAAQSTALSREMQLDLRRTMEARRREQKALLDRAARQMEQSVIQLKLRDRVPPRAVLAHRTEWFRDKVACRLEECGVIVVASVADGAEAAGTIVAEQPELVLVEDRLPTLTGRQVIQRVVAFAPRSLVAAQLEDSREIDLYLADGAQAVFTRRVPPAEVAEQLADCLFGRPIRNARARQDTVRYAVG